MVYYYDCIHRDLPQTASSLSAKGARTMEQHKLLHIIAVKMQQLLSWHVV